MQRPELAPRAASDGTRGKRDPTRDTDDVTMRTSPLQELGGLGQSVWIDYLSRDLIESNGLARAIDEDAVVGVTSNPSIFQKALAHGHAYDEQIAASDEDDAESVFLSSPHDVAAACDLLRPVWERTEAHDGYVSIEVEPTLAADTEATIAQATRFHEAISRPNLLVKIPATDAGVPAIEEMTASRLLDQRDLDLLAQATREIAKAYLRGLERFVAERRRPEPGPLGGQLLRLARRHRDRSPARRARPDDDLKGRLGIANAKLAYQQYGELFAGERWETLRRGGRRAALPVGVDLNKDPSLRDTLYVDELIGPETISTMPAETIRAFQDHGACRDAAREQPR